MCDCNLRSQANTVVVTGASAGVGRAVAKAFGQRGCNVALIARGQEGLAGARSEVEAAGGSALVLPLDVARAEDVMAAAGLVVAEWGKIDIWVNCAMVTIFAPFVRITPAEFRRVTEVTYLGQVNGTMAALAHMLPRNVGTIVQVGSALSYRAIPLQSAYCGAKFAVRGFTDALRSELLHDGSAIRLSMVQLPAVNTPQFRWARSRLQQKAQPVPPIFQPEAIAREIVRASIEAPRELWIGRSSLKAILGTMLLPGTGDRFLAQEGYDKQMTDEPEAGDRPDNLFEPVDENRGTSGAFSDRAERHVVGINPTWLRAAAGAVAVYALARAFAPRRDRAKRLPRSQVSPNV
jgi:NAD(P)-dependent dehydrogenase (short-subunit alcohol dehydrogenase family)